MKTTAIVLCVFFIFSSTIPAQIDCNKFLDQGKKAAKQENYELAINSFNSARRCGDKEIGELVDKEVTKLFNAINKKKEIAERAQKEAEILLKKFQAATADIVDALVCEANILIYNLNYAAATAKLHTAANFGQSTESFKKAVAEIAFFWNEAGQTKQAADLLGAANQSDVPQEQTHLRTWLKEYSGSWYDSLLLRYYPSMLLIEGGDANIQGKKTPVKAFKIASTETTMWQYAIYLSSQGENIYAAKGFQYPPWGVNGDNPVINISWFDAARHANWLSKQFKMDTIYRFEGDRVKEINYTAKGYRLPTDVEWEYAARGGSAHDVFDYSDSNELDSVGWHFNNGHHRTHPVASKKANSLGLYDMSGNVWELCNGLDLDPGCNIRGCSYFHFAEYGPAARKGIRRTHSSDDIGFRVALQL